MTLKPPAGRTPARSRRESAPRPRGRDRPRAPGARRRAPRRVRRRSGGPPRPSVRNEGPRHSSPASRRLPSKRIPPACPGYHPLRGGVKPGERPAGATREARRLTGLARSGTMLGEASAEPRSDAMSERYDAVVIGGGHNGLVAATYLARGGLRVL